MDANDHDFDSDWVHVRHPVEHVDDNPTSPSIDDVTQSLETHHRETTVSGHAPPPTADTLLASARPPSFVINGQVQTCSSAPRLGPNTWTLAGQNVSVMAQCNHSSVDVDTATGSRGATVAGITMAATVINNGKDAITLGTCTLLDIPRSVLPASGQGLVVLNNRKVTAQ